MLCKQPDKKHESYPLRLSAFARNMTVRVVKSLTPRRRGAKGAINKNVGNDLGEWDQ